MSPLSRFAVVPLVAFAVGCVDKPDMQADFPSGPIGYTVPPEPHAGAGQQTTIVITTEGAAPVAVGPTAIQEADPANEPQAEEGYEDQDPSALSDFRSTLEPYGEWAEDPNYGQVWVPSSDVVGDNFAPYVSSGHWTYGSDYTWVSDYDWGWAPFHYGRWAYGDYGWSWIPGRQYAGAWVTWRTGMDGFPYVGWAPLPPSWGWRGGSSFALGWKPNAPYVFCGTDKLFAANVSSHVAQGPQVGAIGSRTQPFVPHPSAGPSAERLAHAGPSPASLHIAGTAVAHPPASDRGLLRAHAYSRPGLASAMGARAPAYRPSMHDPVVRSSYTGPYVAQTRAFAQPRGAYFPPQRWNGGGYAGQGMGRGYGPSPYFAPMGGAVHGTTQGRPAPRSSPYPVADAPARGDAHFDSGGPRTGFFGGSVGGGFGGGGAVHAGGGRGGGRR